MDKYRLRLDEYTISARDNCVLTTPQEAELAFLQQGICGKVMLVQAFKFVTELTPYDNGYGVLTIAQNFNKLLAIIQGYLPNIYTLFSINRYNIKLLIPIDISCRINRQKVIIFNFIPFVIFIK